MPKIGQIQLGKQGITNNFIETIKKYFETHKGVRISVLKSATREKEEIKKFSKEIIEKLEGNYSSKIIGFSIILKN